MSQVFNYVHIAYIVTYKSGQDLPKKLLNFYTREEVGAEGEEDGSNYSEDADV